MGLLTLDQIASEIQAHHANRADIALRLPLVVDLAQMRIARLHDWDQLKFTLNDTLAITASPVDDKIYDLNSALPEGYRMKTLYSVRVVSSDGRSRKLTGKTTTEFDDLIPEPQYYERGFPEWYTQFASVNAADDARFNPSLEIWRVPDVAYNISLRMQVWPLFLTDEGVTGDTPSLLMLDDAIIHLGTSYLYNSFGREDKAKFHFGIYADIIKNAIALDETDFDTIIAGVNVRDGMRAGDYVTNPFISEAP